MRARSSNIVKLAGLLLGSAVVAHLAGLAAANWFRGNISSTTTATETPILTARTVSDYDFGEVWEDPNHLIQVPLRNPKAEPLVVDQITSSCGCTEVSPQRVIVPPGGTVTLAVRLDLSQRPYASIGQTSRDVSVQLRLTGPLGTSLFPLTIQGRVKSRVTLNERDLHFGESCVSNGVARSRAVVATVTELGIKLEVEVQPAIANCRMRSDADGQHRLIVTPLTSLTPGEHAGHLTVWAVDADGTRHHGARIPLSFSLLSAPPLDVGTLQEGKE